MGWEMIFVIIDCRANQIKLLGDRNLGIGFDQFVLMYKSDKMSKQIKFWNSCQTRCVAFPQVRY